MTLMFIKISTIALFPLTLLAPPPGTVTHRAECSSRINTVAYAPNGSRFATGCQDGTAAIWNPANGSRMANLSAPNSGGSGINSMSWSNDSNFLAATFNNGAIFIWRADGGGIPSATPEMTAGLHFNAVVWSPTGQVFATGCTASGGGVAKIWNLQVASSITSREIDLILDGSGPVCTVAWSQDSNLLATGSKAGQIKIANRSETDPAKALYSASTKHSGEINCMKWSGGRHLATGGQDKTVKVWNATGDCIASFTLQEAITSFSWSQSERLAANGSGGIAKVWDIRPGLIWGEKASLLVDLNHEMKILNAAWSSGGDYIITNSLDGISTMWHFGRDQASIIDRFVSPSGIKIYEKCLTSWSPMRNSLVITSDQTAQIINFREQDLVIMQDGGRVPLTDTSAAVPIESLSHGAAVAAPILAAIGVAIRYMGK